MLGSSVDLPAGSAGLLPGRDQPAPAAAKLGQGAVSQQQDQHSDDAETAENERQQAAEQVAAAST